MFSIAYNQGSIGAGTNDEMKIDTEILVVGAGPAGLAAATVARRAGRTVMLIDDNPGPGGQIWRRGVTNAEGKPDSRKVKAIEAFRQSSAALRAGRRVIDAPQPRVLRAIAESAGNAIEDIAWRRLILATGARERFLPFPGWTLPGVFGAGGLQALVKSGFSVEGKRIVVGGTGPLLLAVAYHLQQQRGHIVTVAEQASWTSLIRMTAKLRKHPAKAMQGLGYRAALGRVPYRIGCWPLGAIGEDKLSAVRLTDGKRTWIEPCDLLACGFHLVPNTELALLLGCGLRDGYVAVDADQRTSVTDVYCAGEPTGIAGVDAALAQGTIAGLAAAGEEIPASVRRRAHRERAFGHAMDRAFALRPEILSLATGETIVCRCEDVRYGQLRGRGSWTDAKLHTRCGMGACQARVCGPAVQALFGWRNCSVRPPLYPVPLGAMCDETEPDHDEISATPEDRMKETV